ncbi:MAG: beta strand repeat-containing protein, partial [Candidatus Thorarchaeota archaeon]
MKLSKRTILGLFFVLLVGQFVMPGQNVNTGVGDHTYPQSESQIVNDQEYRNGVQIDEFEPRNDFMLSQDTETGIFDPVIVEQAGYYDTGSISGRTDIVSEGFTDVPIDNASNWVASSAEMELWNLNREYVENGTFDEGIGGNTTYPDTLSANPDGWGIDWDDPSPSSKQTLISYYDNSSDYVTVEIGGVENSPTISYDYYDSTYVLWEQTVQNVPNSDNMTLRFKYNYANGVIDNDPVEIPGYAWLIVWIDNDYYELLDLLTEVDARNTWYDVELTNILNAPSEFLFSLGIWIEHSSASFNLNPASDYDEDGGPDYDYTRSFKVHFDDVSLVSANPPTPEEVELSFHAGDYNTTITGSGGNGTASIDYQYWNDSQLAVGVTANVSISFEYEVWVKEHLFSNSSWTTHPTQKGVMYSVDIGESADLSTFTYIGGDLTTTYENFTVFIYLPPDWENATVYDPFTNDVTSSCTLQSGLVTIPITLLTRLGWWEIDFQSPNYAKSVQTQIDQGSSTWADSSVFRSGNDTRTIVEIGTQSSSPIINGLANVTWMLPNGTFWTEESLTNGTGNIVTSSSWTLGGMNTSAGQWSIDVLWSNGTEVAYDCAILEMYHSANLIALNTEIETDEGLVVTNFLQYIDIDNNEYLMDASATIVGNWSSTQVAFSPDLLRNRWTADFDTSLVAAGHYTVIVNASLGYFDDVSCQFTINSTYVTNFELFDIGDTPIDVDWNENYDVVCRYELGNGTGITGATIQTSYSGPANGLSFSIDSSENNGNYTVTVTCLKSGTYSLTIKASKNYHYQGTDSFTIIVGEENTDLIRTNGTADYIVLGNDYNLVLQYINSTGHGLIGADLAVADVSPSTGISYGSFSDDGNGTYSIILTPSEVETFTIVIRANLTNHVTQITTFTLTVSEIPTELTLDTPSATIAVTGHLIVQANFTDDNSAGLESAQLEIIDPPAGLDFTITEISNGIYNISINPTLTGIYLVTISATLTNYQTSISSFSIVVEETGTTLTILNGTSDIIIIENDYKLVVRYTNSTGHGLAGANLTIVDVSPSTGLAYGSFSDDGNGYYSITLTPSEVETFTIVINGNLTNHVTRITTFTLTGSEIPSELTLDISSVTIDVSDQLIVQANFTDDLSAGIEGALLEIIDPPAGLDFTITEISNGIYNITVNPTITGIYIVTVSATLTNYQTSISSFSIVVEETGTTLTILNGTSDIIIIENDYKLVVQYTNSTGHGLAGANLTVVDVSPSTGLSYGSFSDDGNGYYSITLTPSEVETFTIVIRANLTNHVTQITTFTLTVSEIPTELTLDTSSATIAVTGHLIVQANFTDDLSTGIEGALLEIIDPPAGLDFTITEISNGIYNITVNPTLTGIYLVTVSATLINHQTSISSFSVVIEETGTTLTILNGTSDIIIVENDYKLVVRYTNSTGHGLAGANLTIVDVSPSTGLAYGSFSDDGNGYYSITFTPSEVETFTIVINGNLTNHVTQIITFTLTVSEIPTELTLNTASVTTGLAEQTIVQANFTDNLSTGIEGAQLEIIDPPTDLGFAITEDSNGIYNITISSTLTGIYLITVSATLSNHQTSISSFSIVVEATGTTLAILNGTSDIISIEENYTLIVQYTNSTGHGLDLADLNVIEISPSGLSNGSFTTLGNGYFSVLLTPTLVDTYTITVKANLTNHVIQIGTFTLTITEISTTLSLNESIATILVSEQLVVLATFIDETFDGIVGAFLSIANPPAGLDFNITEISNGNYTITIDPLLYGSYLITVIATKPNYQSALVSFSIIVEELTTSLVIINGTSDAIQFGENYTLVLNYLNGTGFGLANATISVVSISPLSGLNVIFLPELENGSYLVKLNPTIATTFTIVFQSNLTNYYSQFATFTITVSEIPTVLNIDNSGSTVSVDMQYTVQLTLEDDEGHSLDYADITVLNSAGGLLFGDVEELPNGIYRITITPITTGTYQIAFRASLENYHNSTVGFTLIVRSIPTLLFISEQPSSNTVPFSSEYIISLVFNRTDTEENVLSAFLNISTSQEG